MIKSGEALQPLWNLLQDQLLSQAYIHADETPVQVLKEPDKTAQSRSYMWVRVSGLPNKKVTLFDYAPGRGGNIANNCYAATKATFNNKSYDDY